MAIHIENPQIEALARQLSEREGISIEEVVRDSLLERLDQTVESRRRRILQTLRDEIWPTIPPEMRRKPRNKSEEEALIGLDEQ